MRDIGPLAALSELRLLQVTYIESHESDMKRQVDVLHDELMRNCAIGIFTPTEEYFWVDGPGTIDERGCWDKFTYTKVETIVEGWRCITSDFSE